MSEEKITKEAYERYAHRIVSVLDDEEFYELFKKRVDGGASSFKLERKRVRDVSVDWIDTIEKFLPNLDAIVRNPRRFIAQEENVVDVSLAKDISSDFVKYLAQHSNMISKVEKDGSVIPDKILNVSKEDSFEIYENRFVYTLLLKLKDFVAAQFEKLKNASVQHDSLRLGVKSKFDLPDKNVAFRAEYVAELGYDDKREAEDMLLKTERVVKIQRVIADFLASSFAKSMKHSSPVRPPITRTNVILMEPNFKKALMLWQYIEDYESADHSAQYSVENVPLSDEKAEELRRMLALNAMLIESMYDDDESECATASEGDSREAERGGAVGAHDNSHESESRKRDGSDKI